MRKTINTIRITLCIIVAVILYSFAFYKILVWLFPYNTQAVARTAAEQPLMSESSTKISQSSTRHKQPVDKTEAMDASIIEKADAGSKNAFTEADAELLARILFSECRGESREGQLMVAQCVIDRITSGKWGDTMKKVVSARRQFARPGKLRDNLLEVAEAALAGERFNDDYIILYFRKTNSKRDWFAPWLGKIGVHGYYGYPR